MPFRGWSRCNSATSLYNLFFMACLFWAWILLSLLQMAAASQSAQQHQPVSKLTHRNPDNKKWHQLSAGAFTNTSERGTPTKRIHSVNNCNLSSKLKSGLNWFNYYNIWICMTKSLKHQFYLVLHIFYCICMCVCICFYLYSSFTHDEWMNNWKTVLKSQLLNYWFVILVTNFFVFLHTTFHI